MDTSIAIIVLNYNRPQDTKNCIRLLREADISPDAKIIIVNNSSNPQIKSLVSGIKVDKFIQSPQNVGFAKGNNLGIKFAIKQYKPQKILIINPDISIPKTFFKPLLKSFDLFPHAGLIAPVHKHKQKNNFFFGLGGTINWQLGKCTHINQTKISFKKCKKYDFVSFACVIIKQKVFQKAGYLDEDYFMYLEDVDYCLKAHKKGFNSYIDPQVVVNHATSSSFLDPRAKLKHSFISSFILINKHMPFMSRIKPWIHTLIFYPYLYLLWTYHGLKNKS